MRLQSKTMSLSMEKIVLNVILTKVYEYCKAHVGSPGFCAGLELNIAIIKE